MSSRNRSSKLGTFQLIALIFLTVSGGPYGLEPLLNYAGRNGALLLLMITPLLWDIPTIFTVLELNSMMPVTGGYYQWVKKAMGMRWGFYEGWWTWLYTFVDLAIYPVLFVGYASWFFPEIIHYKVIICLLFIWLSAGLNILGIMPIGRTSVLLGSLVITPFILLFFNYVLHHNGQFTFPHLSFKGTSPSALGMGLYTIMWNFIGWDNVTTYAEEVERPVRNYLVSIGIAFLLIFSIYFVTILIASQPSLSGINIKDHGWPALGMATGGYWLGSIISFGGIASCLGLYSAVLLSVSRVPESMAKDGLLPAALNKLHHRYGSPYISIITCSVVISLMILWSFEELLIIDITLYGAALTLEFAALIILRIKYPKADRPFKVPLNIKGLCIMVILPIIIYIMALAAAFTQSEKTLITVGFALFLLVSSELVFKFSLWRKK